MEVFFWNLKHQGFSAFDNRVQSSWQRVARFIFKLNNPSLIHKCINEGILAPSQCKYRLVLSSTITARRSDTLTGMPHPALDFILGCPSHDVLLTASAGFHQAPTIFCLLCLHEILKLHRTYLGPTPTSLRPRRFRFCLCPLQFLELSNVVFCCGGLMNAVLFLFVPFAQKLSGKGNPLL